MNSPVEKLAAAVPSAARATQVKPSGNAFMWVLYLFAVPSARLTPFQ